MGRYTEIHGDTGRYTEIHGHPAGQGTDAREDLNQEVVTVGTVYTRTHKHTDTQTDKLTIRKDRPRGLML